MKTNNESLSTLIVNKSIEKELKTEDETPKKFNMSNLAKNCDMHLSSLWCYLRGTRKWPADSFLRVMIEIGKAQIVDGHLILDLSAISGKTVNRHLSKKNKRKWLA
jgi:hypothetical protein